MRHFTEKDIETLNRWLEGHKEDFELSEAEIPEVGLIVEDVAAGFLYKTDSSIGFLENFVSNPDASGRKVRQAIDEIMNRLIMYAHEEGISRLVGITKRASMSKRAQKHGFKPVDGAWNLLTARVN